MDRAWIQFAAGLSEKTSGMVGRNGGLHVRYRHTCDDGDFDIV